MYTFNIPSFQRRLIISVVANQREKNNVSDDLSSAPLGAVFGLVA